MLQISQFFHGKTTWLQIDLRWTFRESYLITSTISISILSGSLVHTFVHICICWIMSDVCALQGFQGLIALTNLRWQCLKEVFWLWCCLYCSFWCCCWIYILVKKYSKFPSVCPWCNKNTASIYGYHIVLSLQLFL